MEPLPAAAHQAPASPGHGLASSAEGLEAAIAFAVEQGLSPIAAVPIVPSNPTGVGIPRKETERRWRETTPQWPIMHAAVKGVSRDQMMARHKSNHIQVVYAGTRKKAEQACRIKAAAMNELGIRSYLCGDVPTA